VFVTKWEHEQEKTAKKKRKRRAEHDYKYAEQDLTNETLYITCTMDRLYDIVQKEADENACDECNEGDEGGSAPVDCRWYEDSDEEDYYM
jgi:hypothetical protein